MMSNNFKLVFLNFDFKKHNKQYFLNFKMSISQLCLCVHNWIFEQVNILFSVIKQKTIKHVQQFESNF